MLSDQIYIYTVLTIYNYILVMDYFPPFDLDPCSANFLQLAVRLFLKASPEVQALGACQHDLPSPEGKYNWYQCLS